MPNAENDIPRQLIARQRGVAQRFDGQRRAVQAGAHRTAQPLLGDLQHVLNAGHGFETAVVAAVTAFAVGIDTGVADLHHAVAAGVQHMAAGDHPGADVVVDHHLNDVLAAARGAVQRLGHGPSADIVLQVNRQTGAGFNAGPSGISSTS